MIGISDRFKLDVGAEKKALITVSGKDFTKLPKKKYKIRVETRLTNWRADELNYASNRFNHDFTGSMIIDVV